MARGLQRDIAAAAPEVVATGHDAPAHARGRPGPGGGRSRRCEGGGGGRSRQEGLEGRETARWSSRGVPRGGELELRTVDLQALAAACRGSACSTSARLFSLAWGALAGAPFRDKCAVGLLIGNASARAAAPHHQPGGCHRPHACAPRWRVA